MIEAYIGGAPFLVLGHHDGRFVHADGLFAFARRTPANKLLVLHLEMTARINRVAVPGHRRWGWCLAEGMNTLLVHPSGLPHPMPRGTPPGHESVLWHPEAEVWMGDDRPPAVASPPIPEEPRLTGEGAAREIDEPSSEAAGSPVR